MAFLTVSDGLIVYRYDNIYYPLDNTYCIKSSINYELSKALFCLYKETGEANILTFDIYNMSLVPYILKKNVELTIIH